MDDATRRKKLHHLSHYRGFLEADVIFRRFAERTLPTLSGNDLDLYEALLHESDQEVYAWLIGRKEVPEAHNHSVFAQLRAACDP